MGLANEVLIGLAAGTSQVSAVAFAPDGAELGHAAAEVALHHVAEGGLEQDLGDAWQAAAAALRALAARVPDLAARTVALAVTGPGGGAWLIDDDGDPVARAWQPMDRRAAPLVERWRRHGIASEVRAITGSAPTPAQTSAQLACMAERCPALLDQAATALQGKDWLYFCCTGQRATDPASAASAFGDCGTGAYDLRTLELMGLPEVARLLPEALDGTRAPGELTGAAAAATGLLAGTPVVLGPVDLIATALAAGLAQPELRLGCSVLDPEGGGCHIRAERAPPKIPGTASEIAAVLPFAGLWFKLARGPVPVGRAWLIGLAAQLLADAGLIGIGRGELVGILEHKATAARPVALRLHPGAGAADQAGFLGISGATTIYDLLRAICEADGLAARTGYEALGGRPEEIRIVGDGAQSPLARRILAACIDAPVRRLCRETPAAAGAALIAARALGHDLAGDWAGPHLADVEPVDRDLRAIYAKLPGRAPAARDLPAVDA